MTSRSTSGWMPKMRSTWSSMSRCWAVTHTRLSIRLECRPSSRMTGPSLTASGRVPKTVSTLSTAPILTMGTRHASHPLQRQRCLTGGSWLPILARGESADLLVLVYVRHDGAVAETLSSHVDVSSCHGAVPNSAPLLFVGDNPERRRIHDRRNAPVRNSRVRRTLRQCFPPAQP